MNSTELKEAIAEYIKSKELVLMGYSPEYIDDVKTDMEIAFRAGAEWMASREEQEQPEVDLVKEIGAAHARFPEVSFAKLTRIAKRFYELGLNARKDE